MDISFSRRLRPTFSSSLFGIKEIYIAGQVASANGSFLLEVVLPRLILKSYYAYNNSYNTIHIGLQSITEIVKQHDFISSTQFSNFFKIVFLNNIDL